MALGGILNAMSVENKPGGIVWNAQQGGAGSLGGIGTSLRQDLASGEARMNSAVGAAQSGLNAILGMGAQIKNDTNAMRGQAGLVNQQAGKLNGVGDSLISNADALRPLADKLGGYGDDLWGQGQAMWDQSKDAFGQAGALVSMNPNATGLAGEFLRMYGLLSPDRYVSQAASDVQGAYNNAWAQLGRAASRAGSSVGSGNRSALEAQRARSLATALAAAKTKARQTGIDQQAGFLGTMTDAATKFYNMGKDSASTALAAQTAGADAQKAAAGVLGEIGNQYKGAAGVFGDAGQLYANAANIFGDAAGVDLSYGKLTQSGYAGLADAYKAAADYYLGAARVGVSADRGGGGGGVQITQAPEDDWMNWMGTGHSQTWNFNHNPNYETLELMAAAKEVNAK